MAEAGVSTSLDRVGVPILLNLNWQTAVVQVISQVGPLEQHQRQELHLLSLWLYA
jgi:hypothetical protein